MQPANDTILVEPFPENQQPGGGVKTPDSAFLLAKAKVIAMGPDTCVYEGNVVKKSDILPGVTVGSVIHYWKEAENRLTEDGIFRLLTSEFTYQLIMPIKFIRGIE